MQTFRGNFVIMQNSPQIEFRPLCQTFWIKFLTLLERAVTMELCPTNLTAAGMDNLDIHQCFFQRLFYSYLEST